MPGMGLEELKVIDFTWNITGPLTVKALADYGAEVIRIEGRRRPDLARLQRPFKDDIAGVNRSGLFNQWSTGRLGVALDLAHPRGVEIAKRFVAWADVVVESFAGGSMARMGLGYDELRKVKPDIIMLSTCMQGQTGPHANHPGYGFFLTPLSGFTQISGWPDREPIWLGPYTDYVGPPLHTLAILAALDYRRRTGKGQYLDMSQYETAVHFMAPLLLDCAVNGRVADRMGNQHVSAAPHGVYRCQGEDRWCAIAIFADEEWRSFRAVIGNPAWAEDARFSSLLARKEDEEELDRLVTQWTVDYSAENVMALMQAGGIAAGVVENAEDLMEKDPQLRHRRFFRELDHPEMGKYRAAGPAYELSALASEVRSAPLLGEDNEYALKEILGMSDDEIAELVVEGVLE